MKHIYFYFLFFLIPVCSFAQVGIGTSTPHPSSSLDVVSSNKGVLIPRVTEAGRDSILNPSQGLLVYVLDNDCFELFNGISWISLCGNVSNCSFNVTPSQSIYTVEKGLSVNIPIEIDSLGGTPGKIFSYMDNPSLIAGLSLDSVISQASYSPITQTMVLKTSANTPIGEHTLRFRHVAGCGVEKVVILTLKVVGCDFQPTVTQRVLKSQSINTTLTTPLIVSQTGTYTGNVNVSILNLYTGVTASIINNNCSYSCSPVLSFSITDSTAPGSYQYEVEVSSSCATFTKTAQVTVEVGLFRNCREILDAGISTGDGIYFIDPDGGDNPLPQMRCYCDMTSDGGGWTLVMNYFHAAGTNPPLQVMTNKLPIPTILNPGQSFPNQFGPMGLDESGDLNKWGHASNEILTWISFDTIRFYGRTDNHARTVHFKTWIPNLIEYYKTGDGSSDNLAISSQFIAMSGHNGVLPAGSNTLGSSTFQGNFAITNNPFSKHNSQNFFYLRRNGNRWEMDDIDNNTLPSTVHQAWVK